MTVMSKSEVDRKLLRYTCKEIIHPWSDNCVKGCLIMGISSIKGGLKFFSIMYGVHILFKIRGKKKVDYKKELKGFIRSLLFVFLYATTFTGFNCLFRKVLGKFNSYIVFGVVPILCGLAVYLESPGRKALNVTTFLTGAFEGFYRSNINQGNIKSSRLIETLVFMVLNGTLMYALRAQRELNEKHENPWFFVPTKIKQSIYDGEKRECSHEGPCTRSFQTDILKFGGIAFLISLLKLVAVNLKNPSRIMNQIFTWNSWKFTSFVTAYIGVFKVVSCYLCKTRGDSLQNTFMAGLLGGASYAISPNITILFSVFTALVKIIGVHVKEEYDLPDLHYMEIAFVMTNFYMLYLRAFDRHNCPKYLANMLNVVTLNKDNVIAENINKILEES